MAFIQDKDRTVVQTRFEELDQPVKLINFKITLEEYDFVADKDAVKRYSIDKIPATVVEGDKDCGIRFFGIPSGYEFGTLIEDIIMVSKGDSGLEPETRRALATLQEPVHLQVFVTPT
jgi:alkyl hydroperoxide reductase subunit AhpF